tara:strand:+ start:60 stop:1025 length:966 start_codon:yes stop_codon:yes gene_type:complete
LIPEELNKKNIENTYKKLFPYIIKTPIIKSSSLMNEVFNTEVFLKLEFLQNSGTFKARGAINNILNIDKKILNKGITAVSAGNHAIATSYVANKFNLKNKIFIYESANKFRVDICKNLGANLHFTDPHSAFKDVENASNNEGYYFVHPFDGIFTIQGTASLGLEIYNQLNFIDNAIISVGGGGLISGVGSIIKQFNPSCKIIGVEPEGAKGLSDSIKNNKPIKNVKVNSIADSLCSPLHMDYSFNVAKKVIDRIVTVNDLELKTSMQFMFENFKMMLEPACVAGIAALLGPLKNQLLNQKTLVILCGSNIDGKTWNDLVYR